MMSCRARASLFVFVLNLLFIIIFYFSWGMYGVETGVDATLPVDPCPCYSSAIPVLFPTLFPGIPDDEYYSVIDQIRFFLFF